jgi:hypothetical protein
MYLFHLYFLFFSFVALCFSLCEARTTSPLSPYVFVPSIVTVLVPVPLVAYPLVANTSLMWQVHGLFT